MTTEQKIVAILQMGCSLTIVNDCGRMVCTMRVDSSAYDRVISESPQYDGPNSRQLDMVIDELHKEAFSRWSEKASR